MLCIHPWLSNVLQVLAAGQDSEDDQYNYIYDEVDDEVHGGTNGSRLVGARAANNKLEAPFLVAINVWG